MSYPTASPEGETQECLIQGLSQAVRESVSTPKLAALQVPHGCCPQGPMHHTWPDPIQRKTERADFCICLSGNLSWEPPRGFTLTCHGSLSHL